MSALQRKAHRAIYRLDYVTLVKEVFRIKPDPWQANILYAPDDDHLLVCSRQSGKSETAAALTAATAVNRAATLSLVISTGREAAGEFLKKVISKIQLATAEGVAKIKQQNATSITLGNNSRVISLPSTEAATRGWTVNGVLVLDEASRVPDAVIDAVLPVVSVGGGTTLFLSTPNGKANRFAEIYFDEGSHYKKVLVPASSCPRLSAEFLDQQRVILGPTMYAQEYECSFVESEIAAFSYDDIANAFTQQPAPTGFQPEADGDTFTDNPFEGIAL